MSRLLLSPLPPLTHLSHSLRALHLSAPSRAGDGGTYVPKTRWEFGRNGTSPNGGSEGGSGRGGGAGGKGTYRRSEEARFGPGSERRDQGRSVRGRDGESSFGRREDRGGYGGGDGGRGANGGGKEFSFSRDGGMSGGRGSYAARGGRDASSSRGSYGGGMSSRPPARALRDQEDDPRLSTTSRIPTQASNPTVDSISSELLSALRLHLMTHLGRNPSPEELAGGLDPFLASQRKKESKEVNRLQNKIARDEKTAAALDIAWEWGRKQEEQLGIGRDESSRAKDDLVRARIAARKRAEAATRSESKEEEDDDEEDDKLDALPSDAPDWMIQRRALKAKFPDGWAPPKRLSREAITLIRLLQQSSPQQYTTPVLADRFKVSPEAIRRILKSQFELTEGESERREAKRRDERLAARAAGQSVSWAGDRSGERGEMQDLREREDRRSASEDEQRSTSSPQDRYGGSRESEQRSYGSRERDSYSSEGRGYGQRGGGDDRRQGRDRGGYGDGRDGY